MQVAKWGNSLAVRLPARLVRELGLREGDRVDLHAASHGLALSREPRPEEVLDRLRRYRGRLPATERLDRATANGR